MVKVIGKDESAIKRITCRNCASILEYTLSEVKESHGQDISGCSDGYAWILCPSCLVRVVVRSW